MGEAEFLCLRQMEKLGRRGATFHRADTQAFAINLERLGLCEAYDACDVGALICLITPAGRDALSARKPVDA